MNCNLFDPCFYLDKPENTKLVVNRANPTAVPFGSKIIFTCTSNSHPDVQGYRFYRDQELLGTSTTDIFQLTIGHSGLYSCIPFNDVGDGGKAAIAITVDGRSKVCLCSDCISRPFFWKWRYKF